MKTTLNFEVTQKDIDWGVGGHCQFCPLARALARVFSSHHIEVDARGATIMDMRYATYRRTFRLRHTPGTLSFIRNFDKKKRNLSYIKRYIQPGRYQLESNIHN